MSGELMPISPELARWNRIVIAARTGWPAGAVEICEAIEQANPGWRVRWRHKHTIPRFERPAGFYARGSGVGYGLDFESLSAAIEALSSDCPRCGARLPVRSDSVCPPHRTKGGPGWCPLDGTEATVPIGRSP